VSNLVESPVMFLKFLLIQGLEVTPFKGTLSGWLGVLALVSLKLILNDSLEVCVSEEMLDDRLVAVLQLSPTVREGTAESGLTDTSLRLTVKSSV